MYRTNLRVCGVWVWAASCAAGAAPDWRAQEQPSAPAGLPAPQPPTPDAEAEPPADAEAAAEPKPAATPYSGDFWTRSTLTGDWSGARNDLAAKGLTFTCNVAQIYQGVVGGGKDETWEYGGRGDLLINGDTGKMGLWQGGFFTIEAEGNWGESVNFDTGALSPVNSNQIFPAPDAPSFGLPAVNFTQFVSAHAAVFAGKFDTMSLGDMNEFAHGKGDMQFMNLAFGVNPAALYVMPYSPLGAGVLVAPTGDPHALSLSFMVTSGTGDAGTAGFNDLASNNLSFAGEGRLRTDFFGMTGHQLVGGGYNNRTFNSLDQRLPVENGQIETQTGTWCVYYNFDQYFYQPDTKVDRGAGVFGRFGASDGNPNPVHYFFSLGVGAKGLVSSRPDDQCGIGYYYMDVSSVVLEGPLTSRSFLGDEQGVEAYYNFHLTPWLQLTPDIQVIAPTQNQYLSGGQVKNVDVATVVGIRLNLVF